MTGLRVLCDRIQQHTAGLRDAGAVLAADRLTTELTGFSPVALLDEDVADLLEEARKQGLRCLPDIRGGGVYRRAEKQSRQGRQRIARCFNTGYVVILKMMRGVIPTGNKSFFLAFSGK